MESDRLDEREIVVLDVADARTHRPADHVLGRVGRQRLELRGVGRLFRRATAATLRASTRFSRLRDSDSGLQRLLGRRGIGRIAFQQDPGADAVYLRFVHDAGRILNPALFEGQVRGGFAMAIGAALYERFVYTDTAVS